MLAAPHRLRRSDDFRRTVRRGSRSSRSTIVVHMLPPEHDAGSTGSTAEPAKVGFVVSRGVGPAVVRNRVARRLRHLVGGHIAELEPGSHLVVRATPRAAAASSESLGDDLQACLGALRRRGAASPTAGSTS